MKAERQQDDDCREQQGTNHKPVVPHPENILFQMKKSRHFQINAPHWPLLIQKWRNNNTGEDWKHIQVPVKDNYAKKQQQVYAN